jgi:arsenical pump membrane protein
MWALAALAGLLAAVTGWLPRAEAIDIGLHRAGPILGFLVAVTVLAELSDAAGVFDAAARWCARLAKGRTQALFALVAALATIITLGMSLDTTAVLLTPVVLAMTTRLGLAPLPFALLVVWLANTASLLLPVSNLTNLLAVGHTGQSTVAFAARMALPQLAAVVVTVGYLGVVFRRHLRGRYAIPEPVAPEDRVVFRVCAAGCLIVGPAVLLGAPPWLAATAGAVAAVAVFG